MKEMLSFLAMSIRRLPEWRTSHMEFSREWGYALRDAHLWQ